ncbi:MAG: hypothetical protein V3V16_01415 [Melioribacteraceae bacterium]
MGNYNIVWERAKKPFIFVLLILVAVSLLSFLKSSKAAYDKKKQLPIVIVSKIEDKSCDENKKEDDKEPPKNDFKSIAINCVISAIRTPIDSKEKDTLNTKQTKILKKTVNEIKYQEFKNSDALLDSVNEAILKHRDVELRSLFNSLLMSIIVEHSERTPLITQKVKLLEKIDNHVPDKEGKFKVSSFLQEHYPSKSKKRDDIKLPRTILLEIQNKNNDKLFTTKELKDKLKTEIKNRLDTLQATKVKTQHNEDIREIGEKYAPIFKNIFLSKSKIDKEISSKNASKSNVWFDEKGKLHILYTLAAITLNAIIIFTLLYIIVAPLSKLFFLASSSGAITNEAEKLIALKQSSIGSGVVASVIPTLTAIGIGAAAITANQFPSLVKETSPYDNSALVGNSIASNNNKALPLNIDKSLYRALNKFNGGSNLDENSIQSITASIIGLQGSMNSLGQRIEDTDFGGQGKLVTVPIYIPNSNEKTLQGILSAMRNPNTSQGRTLLDGLNSINTQVGDIKDFFGDPQNGLANRNGKLFERMRFISDSINNSDTIKTDLLATTNTLSTRIGNPTDKSTNDKYFSKDNLFGRLNRISTTLGTNDHFTDNRPPVPLDRNSISKRIGFIDTTAAPQHDSLLGFSRLNQKAISSVSKETINIQKNQLGRGDKNLLSHIKNTRKLIKKEQFRVTRISYEAIKEIIERESSTTFKAFLNHMKTIIDANEKKCNNNNKPCSKKDFKALLIKEDEFNSAWKKWHKIILYLTRVRQYEPRAKK